tara:strand:- start:1309 stop:2175 length:867 start_codon:yes stop_codon:yes gene_type:complete
MTNDQNDQEGATLRTTTPGNGLVNGHPAEAGELVGSPAEVKSAPPPPEREPTKLDDGAFEAVKDANPRTVFGGLRPLSYDLIMADPPWKFKAWSDNGDKSKAAVGHYDCMDLDEIKSLPVSTLGRGDCILWLWATHPMHEHAYEVVRAWGFNTVTGGVWVKRTKNGRLGFGTGYRLRSASEPFIIATLGNPETVRDIRTVVETFGEVVDGPLREHSRKPDEAYETAERMFPRALRFLDLFSRQSRPGWDAWGFEAGKFDTQQAEHTFENAGDVAARVVAKAARGVADV